MSFDFSHLYISLLISVLGSAYLLYGRKQMEMSFVTAGLALMGYSYFVSSLWLAGLIGLGIAAAPFVLR